ncbi:Rho termination factor, N-terminal domain [Alkalibacterium subtropicum]|uniref:Rho termination factor, N-terminal domain n=1 Tax=Alkalibacterium subtropicum TaxID=753702 RepID=A0A1I1EU26_9LACT|nr:Rho termination factor N-terminal domain-containing protein [Alkalibacterium subtropicum]SFB90659.1 Rho termination factor, N-terminal domain [Alkalibacterium subtropicum]
MRTFKLDNVIKKTDNDVKIKKYLAMGFKELEVQEAQEAGEDEKKEAPDYESMKVDELKELADEKGLEYKAAIKKDELIALLGE